MLPLVSYSVFGPRGPQQAEILDADAEIFLEIRTLKNVVCIAHQVAVTPYGVYHTNKILVCYAHLHVV